jgi:hypothetical protein
MTENEDVIRKIQALLAKAERTDNEHEQNAYFSKAQTLITKYAVDQWQLTPAEREKIIQKTIELTPKRADRTLLNAVCIANNVKFIVGPTSPRRGRYGYLLGFPSDIAFCEALTAGLLLQRERELSKALKNKPSWEHGKAFNSSFRIHFAGVVAGRLLEWKKVATEEAGTGTELVLASKAAQVEKFTADKFGDTLHSVAGPKTTSALGALAGREAGKRADISGGQRNLGGHKPALN